MSYRYCIPHGDSFHLNRYMKLPWRSLELVNEFGQTFRLENPSYDAEPPVRLIGTVDNPRDPVLHGPSTFRVSLNNVFFGREQADLLDQLQSHVWHINSFAPGNLVALSTSFAGL